MIDALIVGGLMLSALATGCFITYCLAKETPDDPNMLRTAAHGPALCKHPKTCEAPCCYCHPSVEWDPGE